MQKLGALVAVMIFGLLAFFLWLNRFPPFDGLPEAVPMALAEVTAEQDAVQVTGTAHLAVKQRMVRPASLGRDDSTWWLFPLMEKGDTNATVITVMALSPHEPDRLAGFEDLTVSAWARPPAALMTPGAEDELRSRGYSFADDYVLLEVFPPVDE